VLGDRTLLSTIGPVYANTFLFRRVVVDPVPTVLPETGALWIVVQRETAPDLAGGSVPDPLDWTVGRAHGRDAGAIASGDRLNAFAENVSKSRGDGPSSGESIANAVFDSARFGPLFDRLPLRLDFRGAVPMDRDGRLLPVDGVERLSTDEAALPYLLESRQSQSTDRREVGSDVAPPDESQIDELFPTDAMLFAVSPPARNDGSAAGPYLAAVFRSEIGAGDALTEMPAGMMPECLVAYEPDVAVPHTELVPLKDGSQALVAALLSELPAETGRDSASVDVPAIGVAVGIDSGIPIGSDLVPGRAAEVESVGRTPTFSAPGDGATEVRAPVGPLEASPVGRSALYVLDAVFAAGLAPLVGRWLWKSDDDETKLRPTQRPGA
jgi:hypothetical protein